MKFKIKGSLRQTFDCNLCVLSPLQEILKNILRLVKRVHLERKKKVPKTLMSAQKLNMSAQKIAKVTIFF